ncbi:exonuclease/endonuclease/phosphatase family protein [Rubripirellula reticaptiva]|uniref:Endonuclease/Exonuclease/phosphatase family protein n=1 Tax=Rubripirellula reticaptiva TaxID=2528013 RepID=A0A5C6EUY3_9BACT|nr:hypothetical protein [Rubripirellula reticaptiva]TWU51111.1 hypothetical protein Poly59_27000 [Rubripirellula reticaptiva]
MINIFGNSRRTRRSRETSVNLDVPLLRWIGPVTTVVAFFVICGMVLSGQINLSALDRFGNDTEGSLITSTPVSLDKPLEKSADTIRIGTLCLDGFANASQVTPPQVAALANIISQFDVLALQGIDPADSSPIRLAVESLRRSGANYVANVSNPVGRAGHFQAYAMIWDDTRIISPPGSIGVVEDRSDRMLFEPMYGSFESRVGLTDGRSPLRFTLINAYAMPPSNINPAGDIAVLDDVFTSVRNYGYETTGEEDCILVGNLGVERLRLGELGQIAGIQSIAGGEGTSQHILLDPRFTSEYGGKSGQLETMPLAGIATEFPLWAELSVNEVPR